MENIFRVDELNHQLISIEDALRLSNLSPPEIHRLLINDIVHAFKFYPRLRASFEPAHYRQLWAYEFESIQPMELTGLYFSKEEMTGLQEKAEEELFPEPLKQGLQINFFKHGAGWLVGEPGQEVSIPNIKGVALIHYLLSRMEVHVTAQELFYLGEQPIEEIEIKITDASVSDKIGEACRKKVRDLLKRAVELLRAELNKSVRTRHLMVYFSLDGDGKTIKTGTYCCYRLPDNQPVPKFIIYA